MPLWTPSPLSRRRFLTGAAAAGAGLALPTTALAGGSTRRFIFIFCDGGWDQTLVFAPTFDSPALDDEDGAQLASAGGLSFVEHEQRPSVSSFMAQYWDRTCFLNGFEIPSIAHDRCRQLVLTGSADARVDDWPALLAGNGGASLMLPNLIASGPSYSAEYTSLCVRFGETGQLSSLVDGRALDSSDQAARTLDLTAGASVDAYLTDRAAEAAAAAGAGRTTQVADAYAEALDRALDLEARWGDLNLSIDVELELIDQIQPVLGALEAGLTRCANISFKGVNHIGWDSHAASYSIQSGHFELLFEQLLKVMSELESRRGISGRPLSEEVTLVVFSEMGRVPYLNLQGGKDHWTFSSAMLVGAGVRGGQVVGGYGEDGKGVPTDLTSGQPHDSGEVLTANHFGATLLALGDVDPAEYITNADPIEAVIA